MYIYIRILYIYIYIYIYIRWFTETDIKHFKIGALWTITNITKSIVNWKKEFLHGCISKILFIDTEKLSKMEIPFQLFFKDITDRFRITYLKNGFFWSCFSKMLLIDFRIATNLKTGLSKKCFWKILCIHVKTTTKIIYLKVH